MTSPSSHPSELTFDTMSPLGTTIQPSRHDEVALPAKDHIVKTAVAESASPAVSESGGTKRPVHQSSVNTESHGGSQVASVKRRRLSSIGLLALCDSDDVVSRVLGFLSAKDVDGSLKLVCKAMKRACDSPQYWRELLNMYGKPLPNASSNSSHGNPYRQLYYRNPCVPVDFGTISEALTKCSRAGSTITLMPGVYEEQLSISDDVAVTIQAAKPDVGAALVHCMSRQRVERGHGGPVVRLLGGHGDAGPTVRLSHLQILHSAPDDDMIATNVALLAAGASTHLLLDSCTIQSSSGRGIVVYASASFDMKRTTVHDCAATGLWTSRRSESANVAHCNLIRNGYGWEDDYDLVSDGHSGIYAMSDISVQDSLIASNSHTGLTVLHASIAQVSGCDITGNGSEPLTDVDPASRVRHGPGILLQGPVANNTASSPGLMFGAPTRETAFPSVLEKPTTKRELSRKFRAFRS